MMKNQLAGLMKQAQQMQENLKKAQDELAQMEVEGQSGAGLVKVVMTCKHDVKRVTIDPSLIGEDKDMLEDLLAAAVNDAVRRVEAHHAGENGGPDDGDADAARIQASFLTDVGPPTRSVLGAPEPVSGLDALAKALRCLPGVGPKAAQRIALHLLQHDREGAQRLAKSLVHAAEHVRHCERCNTFTEDAVCALCRSGKRDPALLCVVETPADLLMVENTQAYSGLYFVLMGRLSPLDGIGPKEIRLERLDQAGDRRRRPRSRPGDQFHERGRGHGPLHRGAARLSRAQGHAARTRRPGGRRARVRGQRHASRSASRTAGGGCPESAVAAVRPRTAKRAMDVLERPGYTVPKSGRRCSGSGVDSSPQQDNRSSATIARRNVADLIGGT